MSTRERLLVTDCCSRTCLATGTASNSGLAYLTPKPLAMTTIEELMSLGSFATMDKRLKVGHFSVTFDNASRQLIFSNDDSKRVFFRRPHPSETFDLLKGFDPITGEEELDHDPSSPVQKSPAFDISNTRFGHMLKWIVANRRPPLGVDFVATRRLMRQLLVTPYQLIRRQPVKFRATKYLDTIYMYLLDNFDGTFSPDNNLVDKLNFSGNRFENFVTRPAEHGADPDEETELNQKNEYFKCVVQSAVFNRTGAHHSFLMPSKVDAMIDNYTAPEDSMSRYVEIRTVKKPASVRRFEVGKAQLINWWAQAYVAGIQKIFCGFRDEEFQVTETAMMKTYDLPFQCQRLWSKPKCLNFLCNFLTFVKHRVAEDDPKVVYEFTLTKDSVDVELLGQSQECGDVLEDQRVIPDWFVEKFRK